MRSFVKSRVIRAAARGAGAAWLGALLSGCALGFNPQRDPAAVEIPGEGVEATLAVVQHLPFVQVSVDKSEPMWFLIDTGAFTVIIDDDAARAAGVEREMRFGTHITSAGETFGRMDLARFDSLTIGGATFRSFEGLVTDLSHLEEALGHPMDGVIGMPLIRHGVWTIDYAGGRLRLEAALADLADDEHTRSFMFSGETPAIEIRPAGLNLSAEIDTGSANGLIVSDEDAARLALERDGRILTSHLTLTGKAWKDLVRLEGDLEIGALTLERPLIHVSRDTMLGGELLRRFVVTIDASRQLIRLTPVPGADAAEEDS